MARKVFEDRLSELHESLMAMGLLVEEAIYKSVKSLAEKNIDLAIEIVEEDQRINQYEVEIEKKCFELIALQQPVGIDLRRIATMLKVVTDLERMGDHAVSIAKSTIHLKDEAYIKPLIDIPKMADLVKEIVREALDAYISLDQDSAILASKKDDQIDQYLSKIFMELIEIMQEDQTKINQAIQFLLVSQHLERIGDYVTNICEWIVYLKTGSLIDLNE
ncbi:phosphate signaling complex protein PhoU [Heyndrickxia sporothermodurans]